MANRLRVALGILIWIAVGISVWQFGFRNRSERVKQLGEDLVDHASGRRQRVIMYMEDKIPVGVGDPVFVIEPDGSYRQVGEVEAIPARVRLTFGTVAEVKNGEILLYGDSPPLGDDAQLTFHETPESMQWVLQTMLPPSKRAIITSEISKAIEENHVEIVSELQPIIEDGFRDALTVVEEDLQVALIARSNRLERIGASYQVDLVEREIVPLVKAEIWPIVRRYGEPVANDVGREIWDRASLWRFGWRYMYDLSPLPRRDLARKEFQRFVDNEAVPVLEAHIDDFVRMQQRAFTEIARNQEVQAVVRRSVRRIVKDPEVREIVMEIVREVLVDNPRLRDVLRTHWQSDRAQSAFRVATARLEPTAVRIGELLFGTPETGVTPEFARVLRNQVLKKDRRWLVLHPGQPTDGPMPKQVFMKVNPGDTSTENPFVVVSGNLP